MSENVFGGFENDFKEADKAEPMASPGRIAPGTYKVVCTAVDPDDKGQLVDHQIIDTTSSKGFKLFFEVLEPETMKNERSGEDEATKGKVVEHVFWITKKNLPYVKRDVATILGHDLENLTELTKISWAGKTCEIVVKDDDWQGFRRSKVAFINEWKPDAGTASGGTEKPEESKKTPTEASKSTSNVDF